MFWNLPYYFKLWLLSVFCLSLILGLIIFSHSFLLSEFWNYARFCCAFSGYPSGQHTYLPILKSMNNVFIPVMTYIIVHFIFSNQDNIIFILYKSYFPLEFYMYSTFALLSIPSCILDFPFKITSFCWSIYFEISFGEHLLEANTLNFCLPDKCHCFTLPRK